MTAPITLRINRRRCRLLGSLQAAMALLVLTLVAVPLWLGVFHWLIIAGLLTAALFGWFAIFFFGLAAKNPTALRMDADGVSGFYTAPARWDEITAAFAFSGSKGHRFLGFTLADPIAFRARQTRWQRFQSWSNGKSHGAHITIPQIVLAETDAETLARKAQSFLPPSKS